MRLYGIRPVKRTFSWGEMQVVELGEEGRGRELVIIPFFGDIEKDKHYEIAPTRSGRSKIIKSDKETPGWIAKLSASGCYTRGTQGSVYVMNEDIPKIEVLEMGWGAYGDAGRLGSWDEFLVVVKDFPARFKIKPAGGSSKIRPYWVVFTEDKVYVVEENEVEIFSDQMGIELQNNISNLGPLSLK